MSSFFRVLHEDDAAKLKISPLFVSRFSTLIPKTVKLKCFGSWMVDIEEEEGKELYFKRGWNTFVEDNALETGQLIVFKFDGDSTFKAKVYGQSSCEKKLEMQPCINSKYCMTTHYNKRKRIQVERDPIEVEDAEDSQNEVEEQSYESDGPKEKTAKICGKSVHKKKLEDQPCTNQKSGITQHRNKQTRLHVKNDPIEVEETEASPNEVEAQSYESDDPKEKTGNMYESNEGPGSVCDKNPSPTTKSFISLSEVGYENPSFKIILKPTYAHKGCMLLPAEFFHEHMENERQEVEIETGEGLWTVTSLPYTKGKTTLARLTKGWSQFVKANSLKTGDTLVFELVRKGDLPKFLVHR